MHSHGEPVALTQREFDLLLFLARHPGRAFTREELMDHVWQYAFYTDTSTVTVHIRRLRTKLEADPEAPRWIETVWGVGYRFAPSLRASSLLARGRRASCSSHFDDRHGAWVTLEIVTPLAVATVLAGEWIARRRPGRAAAPVRRGRRCSARCCSPRASRCSCR